MEPENEQEHWGYHLLIDIGGCNDSINDIDTVKRFIKELMVKIDMKPIGDVIAYYIDDETGKGVSAVQIITTSTLTFHGDDLGKCVYLDVFSCKPYDINTVFDLIDYYFEPKFLNHHFLHRNATKKND